MAPTLDTGRTGLSRRRIEARLYLAAVLMAALGAVLCTFYLVASLEMGPDQLAVFLTAVMVVGSVVLGGLFFMVFSLFRQLHNLLGEVCSGSIDGNCAVDLWRQASRFPFVSAALSMSSWVVIVVALDIWMVVLEVMSMDQALLAGVSCALIGFTTSAGYLLRSRSILKPALELAGAHLPEGFEPEWMVSIRFKLLFVGLTMLAALAVSLGSVSYLANLKAEQKTALAIAADRIETMIRDGKALYPENLGPIYLRPFIMSHDGAQKEGEELDNDVKRFIRDNHRLMGKTAWEGRGSFQVWVAKKLMIYMPLPEYASMPDRGKEHIYQERMVFLKREPMLGGLHPGVVIDYRTAGANRSAIGEDELFTNSLVLFAGGLLLSALIFLILFAEDLRIPLASLRRVMLEAGRESNLMKVSVVSDDEVGELQAAVNRMNRALSMEMKEREDRIRLVRAAVGNLTQVMNRLLEISSEQATDASEQAVSMHEISTTSEEIAATLRVIAENAQSVEEVAGQSLFSCRTGQQHLDEVISGIDLAGSRSKEVAERMLSLQEQFNRIESILDFIREVSEKINLIALNASIEASGAGEAGERFSIIAGEMRKLAESTMSGTREIQTMFADLQRAANKTIIATEEGEKVVLATRGLVDKASDAFQSIVHWAGETARAAHEIAISSNQQTTATDHLASALGEIKEVASRFAERSTALAGSVREIENIGEELGVMVEAGEPDRVEAAKEEKSGDGFINYGNQNQPEPDNSGPAIGAEQDEE